MFSQVYCTMFITKRFGRRKGHAINLYQAINWFIIMCMSKYKHLTLVFSPLLNSHALKRNLELLVGFSVKLLSILYLNIGNKNSPSCTYWVEFNIMLFQSFYLCKHYNLSGGMIPLSPTSSCCSGGFTATPPKKNIYIYTKFWECRSQIVHVEVLEQGFCWWGWLGESCPLSLTHYYMHCFCVSICEISSVCVTFFLPKDLQLIVSLQMPPTKIPVCNTLKFLCNQSIHNPDNTGR